ncbi:hypothetical protein MBHK15_60016 [Marinobacter salarius]|nr:hypothetical protein MBHK15_60016 [Marinobacter salarius]
MFFLAFPSLKTSFKNKNKNMKKVFKTP